MLTARTELTDRMLTAAPPSQPPPPPAPAPDADLSKERIERRPVLGGLINEYQRAA